MLSTRSIRHFLSSSLFPWELENTRWDKEFTTDGLTMSRPGLVLVEDMFYDLGLEIFSPTVEDFHYFASYSFSSVSYYSAE